MIQKLKVDVDKLLQKRGIDNINQMFDKLNEIIETVNWLEKEIDTLRADKVSRDE